MPTSAPTQTSPNTNEEIRSSPSNINKRWRSRRRGACRMCKLKKIRCDGATPCSNCRRHDHECQYTLPKKRQALKKPAGSVSEKYPEVQFQIDEIRDSPTKALVDVSSVAELSPLSTLSSTGVANPLTNRPYNNLQAGTSVPNDDHMVPALPDKNENDGPWVLDIGQDNLQNISAPSQTADRSNVQDCNAFSWPLFTSETDWQLDFDMPFTAERNDLSTGASPNALTELDASHFYHQSAQCLDSTGSSAELIEYLSLNEKEMPMKNFLDPVPSINFSLKAIFSTQDRRLEGISRTKQDEIDRNFKSISLVDAQLLRADRSDRQCHDSQSTWYWNDAALMESCKAACFQQPLGISNFLTRSHLDACIKEARDRSQGGSMLTALIDSAMAFGYQACITASQRFISLEERAKALSYSKSALRSRGSVLHSPDTLLKLQTILAMTTVAEQIDETMYSELLTGAISCARSMKLENHDLMHSENSNSKDQDLARRSLWFLYFIEVPYSLRRGISPALDHDWIDQAPPQAGEATDWFRAQCLYATVLSSAAKMLYNQQALRQSLMEREQKLDVVYKLLENWKSRLPHPLQDIHKLDMRRTLDDLQIREMALTMFRQYHEAIFMIYFPWAGSQSAGRISEDYRRRSRELCVNSAQDVLAIAYQISSLDILDNKFLEMISVSFCITFLDGASSNNPSKSISYLGMGCGIFGRLNLDNEVPLADVLELAQTAQQIKGR